MAGSPVMFSANHPAGTRSGSCRWSWLLAREPESRHETLLPIHSAMPALRMATERSAAWSSARRTRNMRRMTSRPRVDQRGGEEGREQVLPGDRLQPLQQKHYSGLTKVEESKSRGVDPASQRLRRTRESRTCPPAVRRSRDCSKRIGNGSGRDGDRRRLHSLAAYPLALRIAVPVPAADLVDSTRLPRNPRRARDGNLLRIRQTAYVP